MQDSFDTSVTKDPLMGSIIHLPVLFYSGKCYKGVAVYLYIFLVTIPSAIIAIVIFLNTREVMLTSKIHCTAGSSKFLPYKVFHRSHRSASPFSDQGVGTVLLGLGNWTLNHK